MAVFQTVVCNWNEFTFRVRSSRRFGEMTNASRPNDISFSLSCPFNIRFEIFISYNRNPILKISYGRNIFKAEFFTVKSFFRPEKIGKKHALLCFNRVVHKILNLVYPLLDKPIHHRIEKCFCCHSDKNNKNFRSCKTVSSFQRTKNL